MEKPLITTKSDQAWLDSGGWFSEKMPLEFKSFYESFVVFTEDCIGGKAGDPCKLMDWQYEKIIKPWFGCYNADGTYRYNEAIIVCGKKQSKTSLCAAFNIFHQTYECKTAEAYIIAANVRQAGICFKNAERILRYGPLKELLRTRKDTEQPIWIHNSTKLIEHVDEDGFKSTFQILPFSEEVDGFSASMLTADEFCSWPAKHAKGIWEKLDGSTMSRNGRKILISTPQYDLTSWGYSKYLHAKRILDSTVDSDDAPFIDTTTLPVIFGVPDDESCRCGKCTDGNKEAWRCPYWWEKSNPSFGITVPRDFYAKEYAKVQNDPHEEVKFKNYFCAMWVGNSHQWLSSNLWAKCYSDVPLEYFEKEKIECVIGIDMARRQDLAAVVMSFKLDGQIHLFGHAFLPLEGIEKKEKRDRKRYRAEFVAKGLMTLTAGDVIDQRVIREYVKALCKRFKVTSVRYDPSRFEQTAIVMLNEDNLPMAQVTPSINQMHQPTLFFERGVTDQTIRNDGNPLMLSCLQNTTIKMTPDGMIKIDKHKSTGRIDLIIASILACSGWVNAEPVPESYGFFA
ncbi:terminase TerL endonuclease subunit [Lacunimicrobium album]